MFTRKGKVVFFGLLAAIVLFLIQIPSLKQFSPLFFILAGILLSLAFYQSYQQTKEKKNMGLVLLIGASVFLVTFLALLILRFSL